MKILHVAVILLSLSGVLTQDSDYKVKYPDNPICAVRGFSVSIPCSYYYPTSHQVTQKLWCSMNSNSGVCQNPPYVYNSSSNTKSDFEFTGDNKSDCTLLIHNVQFNYSGVYKFRFITNTTDGKWTEKRGVSLQVGDLKVSLIRLSGNGNLKHGDSLNLTCDVTCTQSSSQFVWSKNDERLPESGPVLHFPALTLRDSGKYNCTWKTNTTSGSKTINLQVEGNNAETSERWFIWMVVCMMAGVIVIVAVISVAVINIRRLVCDRRRVHATDNSNLYANVQQRCDPDRHANVRQSCVSDLYANVQKKCDPDRHANVQQMDDISDIYANVQANEDNSDIYANIQ